MRRAPCPRGPRAGVLRGRSSASPDSTAKEHEMLDRLWSWLSVCSTPAQQLRRRSRASVLQMRVGALESHTGDHGLCAGRLQPGLCGHKELLHSPGLGAGRRPPPAGPPLLPWSGTQLSAVSPTHHVQLLWGGAFCSLPGVVLPRTHPPHIPWATSQMSAR